MKEFVYKFLPPIIIEKIYQLGFYGNYWRGDFKTWEEAREKSKGGYDCNEVFEAMKKADYEYRDRMISYSCDKNSYGKDDYFWPILSCFLYIAAREKGKLNIIDFGGGVVGCMYYRYLRFFRDIEVRWNIIEQKHIIEYALALQEEIQRQNNIFYYYTIEECVHSCSPNTILLSGVLQCIENPYELLNQVINYGFQYLIISRVPLVDTNDRLTVQRVSRYNYGIPLDWSCPSWFFNEKKFLETITKQYRIIESFDNMEKYNIPARSKGFLLERKNY